MLISCKYQSINWTHENFTSFYDYNFGNCYTFNSDLNQPKESVRSGPIKDLRLKLYAGNIETEQQFTYSSGFRVIIHNHLLIVYQSLSVIVSIMITRQKN
ncbi:unnamed protein product [Brachionus calyciflorus]|uniref:Uncharacterized protein n=1 Tax=Brachionus calyciflorus TaxID=104777 RepID=A0A813RPW3_9BILA|nr:unnamed protein product [Brachionus calyciflorus]